MIQISDPITIDGRPYSPPSSLPPAPIHERWIGPIPSVSVEADGDGGDALYHAGGAAPAWGGYKPTLREGRPSPHSSASLATLECVATPEGLVWYVSAPSERRSYRGALIGCHAVHEGRTREDLLAIGLREDEADEAFAALARRTDARLYPMPRDDFSL